MGRRKKNVNGKAPVVRAALIKWIDNSVSFNAPVNVPLVEKMFYI